MKPPRRDTTSARRYKGFISARVPGKKNCYREPNIDQHYLFARVAYRRELASMFLEECAVFSCDNMNKIKVGSLAVSRYHQIERLYDTSDVPNYPNHDFPVPGYHLIPAGYMRLTSKSSTVSTSSDIDVMNDVLLEPSQNDHTEPPDCDNKVQYCSSLNSTPPISDICISSDNEGTVYVTHVLL